MTGARSSGPDGGEEAGAGRDNATPNAAAEYDRKVRLDIPHYDLIHDEIVDFAKTAGERFGTWLDTGCGTGTLAARLLEERICERMILADPSEAMLAIARERVPGARVLQVPTAGIELEPGSIDAISAIQAHHYASREDRRAALERCRALLRPGGLLVVSENVAPEDPASADLFLRRWGAFQVRSGKTPAQAAEHAARYGAAYFPIPVSEHLSLLRSTGFVRADLLWKSHMQAVLVAWSRAPRPIFIP